MGFDVENFGLGLVAGWATGYGVYRARHLISSAVQSASQQATSAQNYATQSTDTRYINNMARWAQRNHLAGTLINLSEVLVEPRFIPPPPLVAPPDDDVSHSVFHVVPHIPDLPYLQAPYNIQTLSIDELVTGDRALALLGNPGSGRTTALLAILLRSLGQLHFTKPLDRVQQKINAEEAAMDEKKRAVRIKERLLLEQRARERLAEERGMVLDEESDSKVDLPLLNRLMPVYIHLVDVRVEGGEIGRQLDPAEPLVRAVQRQLGRVAASTIPRTLYNRLNKGQVLVLIDGYDDLPENEQQRTLTWLQALIDTYRDNFFIVAGPASGHGSITRTLRLTPVHIRPWSDQDITQAVDNWAVAWPRTGRRRLPVAKPADDIIAQVKMNCRTFSPVDVTLKILATFANINLVEGREDWIRAFITHRLSKDQSLDTLQKQLMSMAALQLDEGYITQARLLTLLGTETKVSPTSITEAEPSLEETLESDEPTQNEQTSRGERKSKEETNPYAKLLANWQRSGLLVRHRSGRYRFRHSHIADYLAGLSLHESQTGLQEKAINPKWRNALAFAALHTPMDPLVRERLTAPTDIIQSNVLEMAHWLANAPADVEWRAPFLKYMSNVLVAPNQYPLLRERAAAALIATRDESALQIFRQASKSLVPNVRKTACLGLGAIGHAEGVADITPLLQDSDNDVQLTAALGLGAIRTEEAFTALIEAFTEGSEALRQVIAEAFADIPEEGYPVLYDAIQDEEMMLRRAAVFGIRRLKSDWAMLSIYRAFLEDSQWYVRSAAQIAFQEMQYGRNDGPRSYPPPEAIIWLNEWAAKRGENISPDESAAQVLLKAMQEGESDIRGYATANMGQLGLATMAKPLYITLRDQKSEIRDIAHRALAELQMQMGKSLPAPV
jgi:HEAT repeat protein